MPGKNVQEKPFPETFTTIL